MQTDKAIRPLGRAGSPARPAGWRRPLVLLLAALAAGCAQAPAEERLRERIATMEVAVESRQVDGFLDGVAENFIGEGGVDRQGLRRLLVAQMLRNAEVSVVLGPLDIEINGDQARVQVEVVVTGGAGGFLPERAQSVRLDSAWRDGEDGWQVVTADWTERF